MDFQFNIIKRHKAGTIIQCLDYKSNKKRPFLIISNDNAAIDGDSDYIVLPITSKERTHLKNHHIKLNDYSTYGLSKPSFIKGNKPTVISKEEIDKVYGVVPDKTLNKARKILKNIIEDKSLTTYKLALSHWIEAYNTIFKTDYNLENATDDMRDEFHISLGRYIQKNKTLVKIVIKPDYKHLIEVGA